MMDTTRNFAPPAGLDRLRQRALIVGLAATAGSIVGAFVDQHQFFRSYLVAFLYVLAVPLGALGIMMLHHLTRGAWGVVIRRTLEAASRTLPLMIVFFLPILFGMQDIFHWSEPGVVEHDELLAKKAPYLNVPFFLVRAALYFLIWTTLAVVINRLSLRQDDDADPRIARRMQAISAAGVILFVLTCTFASFDWLMSLDPHWFSSIYGVYFTGSVVLSALAFVVPVSLWLARREPMADVLRPSHFHDHGKLLLAFLMLWGYFSVSQLIIIWSGNLPEEVPWYTARVSGGWKYVSQAIIVLHFFLPFLLLLSTDIKRDARRLATVACFVLLMRWVDLFWQAAPSMHVHGVHWLDIVLLLALGGLWLAFFFVQLKRRPLIPRNEPFLEEALGHHG